MKLTKLSALLVSGLAIAGCGKKKDGANGTNGSNGANGANANGANANGASANGASANGANGSGSAGATPTPPPANGPSAVAVDAVVGPTASGCQPPSSLTGDYTILKSCTITLADNIAVEDTGTLTIQGGAKLAFAKERHLGVKGKLVIAGTADAPVVLTSAESAPNPGDWEGVLFWESVHPGTSIDHAHIEFAGASVGHGKAAIQLMGDESPNRVSITNSEIVHSVGAGITIEGAKSLPAKLENNTFSDDGKTCIAARAEVWGAIGVNKCGDQLAHVTGGGVSKSATWPALDAAYVLDDSMEIGTTGDAPIWTLPDGATVKVTKDHFIRIGTGDGGGVVAKKVKFTSAAITPDAGDWNGLIIEEKATGTTLDGSTIEYAGGAGGHGKAPLVIVPPVDKIAKRVAITNVTFSNNANPGIDAPDSKCAPYDDPASGNKGEGSAALCKK